MSELLAGRSPENLDSSYQPARPGRVRGRGLPAEATWKEPTERKGQAGEGAWSLVLKAENRQRQMGK